MSRDRLIADINRRKRELGAVILAHNYQPPEIYEVADFIGDSLELARRAAEVRPPLIVFCGVRFMAETAKLLCPDSTVVLAEPHAGCEMADMISAEALGAMRARLGDVTVVAYVNTPADVKAESDICCTSANAVRVIESLPADRRILFVPDRNLARYVARETRRDIIPWEGFCYVHALFTPEDVDRARREHPDAYVVAHPECPLEVIDRSDEVASTGGMLRLAAHHSRLVLGTEVGMCQRVRREYPDCECSPMRRMALCRNMKRTTLARVREALEGGVEPVAVPGDIAARARRAIELMLGIG